MLLVIYFGDIRFETTSQLAPEVALGFRDHLG